MRDTLLRDTDAVSMRHSLEVRVPFLDTPLVDYVSRLPGHVNRGQASKALLRKAGRGVLSDRITSRPKTGFTLPIGDWMRGPMREPCEAAISTLAGQSFIDGAEVRRTWQSFVADERSMHWSRPLALVVLGSYLV
jgi:asparagine synthase (glutamine-hydrolysing)